MAQEQQNAASNSCVALSLITRTLGSALCIAAAINGCQMESIARRNHQAKSSVETMCHCRNKRLYWLNDEYASFWGFRYIQKDRSKNIMHCSMAWIEVRTLENRHDIFPLFLPLCINECKRPLDLVIFRHVVILHLLQNTWIRFKNNGRTTFVKCRAPWPMFPVGNHTKATSAATSIGGMSVNAIKSTGYIPYKCYCTAAFREPKEQA